MVKKRESMKQTMVKPSASSRNGRSSGRSMERGIIRRVGERGSPSKRKKKARSMRSQKEEAKLGGQNRNTSSHRPWAKTRSCNKGLEPEEASSTSGGCHTENPLSKNISRSGERIRKVFA